MLSVFYYSAVAIILAYLGVTIAKFGRIPISISDTYYMWKGEKKEWLFTSVMWVVGVLILIYWVSRAEFYKCQFLPFVSVSGMVFVGGACMFKETLTRAVYFTSAGIWAGGAVAFFVANSMYVPMIVGFMFGFTGWMLNKRDNFTFWAEMACVVMMIYGIWLL
jgi:hypothetical protein